MVVADIVEEKGERASERTQLVLCCVTNHRLPELLRSWYLTCTGYGKRYVVLLQNKNKDGSFSFFCDPDLNGWLRLELFVGQWYTMHKAIKY